MDISSIFLWWIVTTIVAIIPIWGLQKLNSLWIRPKRLEKLLRAQGLQGDSYKLKSDATPKQMYMLKMQYEAKFQPIIPLPDHDVAPHIFTTVHHTVDKYGKNSFIWEGRTPKVVIMDPVQIKEVFNRTQDFKKVEFNSIAKFLTVGLTGYNGQKWARIRKIINPAFQLDKLKNMIPAFLESSHDMIGKWKDMLSSDVSCEIDVWPFLQNLSCDAISRTSFGSNYAEGTKIFELLKRQGDTVINTSNLPKSTTMEEMDRDIYDSVNGIIKKREKIMKNGEASNEDLLGILLESNHIEIEGNAKSNTAGMTNEEVIKECKHFYLAGQETTSSLLVWTMVLLARYPEWQARARQEVLQVFGNHNPNYNGLTQLKIVTMILYEVLRLYPPAIYLVRAVQNNLKLGNLSLPSGIQVSIPIHLVHHDCDIWGVDAMEFKPGRFSEGIAKATKGHVSYFPFGWGPRICIGQNFSLLEAKIVLSLLLQNFSFELSPKYNHVPTAVLTLQPKHGALFHLHKM